MMELMPVFLPVPRALTVTVSAPPAGFRVFPVTVQPAAEVVSASPNVRLPMTRSTPRVTVISEVALIVEKLAVKPDPSAMFPPDQGAAVFQAALEVLVHVPLAAKAWSAKTRKSATDDGRIR
jgi:glutathione S-transferase